MSKSDNVPVSEKIRQLSEQVAWFENDTFELEQAIDKFEVAEKLAKDIEVDLKTFKNKLTVIKKDFSKE
jgi:exonuclease VII small subunit